MIQKIMPKDIRLVQEYESNDWVILGNSSQIQQVMMNLCTNAAHAMNNKGDIHIKYFEEKFLLQLTPTIIPFRREIIFTFP